MSAPALRWRRLGRLLDPSTAGLPGGCREFAQSPQALVLDDRVRIYFSSRTRDLGNGKYVSHVCFVDMSPDLGTVFGVNREPVIARGRLGCFDEHGIFPFSVLRHEGRVCAYTTGWSRRVSVSVDTAIGLAVSDDDGRSFRRHGDGPVMGASLHEPFLVGDAFVRVFGGVFHMWYIFGTAWKRYAPDAEPDRTYKIGHAVSEDGIHWQREEAHQIVADRLDADESQALPTVARIGGLYHMFFCYRHSADFRANRDRGYRLGHAVSEDLREWTRDDEAGGVTGRPGEWDSDMQCYPHLFTAGRRTFLLYNGNAFGRHGFGASVLE